MKTNLGKQEMHAGAGLAAPASAPASAPSSAMLDSAYQKVSWKLIPFIFIC